MPAPIAVRPWSAPLPDASPPDGTAVFRVHRHGRDAAAFAVQGGSFRDRRRFAATAVLVRHPAATCSSTPDPAST